MSNTLARSFTHTPSKSTVKSHRKMRKYLDHWLKNPFVDPASNVKGIIRLSGINELCRLRKSKISKYIRYFMRVCVTKEFCKSEKVDLMVIAMVKDRQYKKPSRYLYCIRYTYDNFFIYF